MDDNYMKHINKSTNENIEPNRSAGCHSRISAVSAKLLKQLNPNCFSGKASQMLTR